MYDIGDRCSIDWLVWSSRWSIVLAQGQSSFSQAEKLALVHYGYSRNFWRVWCFGLNGFSSSSFRRRIWTRTKDGVRWCEPISNLVVRMAIEIGLYEFASMGSFHWSEARQETLRHNVLSEICIVEWCQPVSLSWWSWDRGHDVVFSGELVRCSLCVVVNLEL